MWSVLRYCWSPFCLSKCGHIVCVLWDSSKRAWGQVNCFPCIPFRSSVVQHSSNIRVFPLWVSTVVKQLPTCKDRLREWDSFSSHSYYCPGRLPSLLPMNQICVWGCPDLHNIDVIDFVALQPLLLAAAEILLLFWRAVLFQLSFCTNGGGTLPSVSHSERAASPHWLQGGCGSSRCWITPPCDPMGSAIAASFQRTKHHPSPLLATSQFAGGFLGRHVGGTCSDGKAF